ncbi:calcium-independent phospholipase A2-gamma-like [Glandiceps talaboti]
MSAYNSILLGGLTPCRGSQTWLQGQTGLPAYIQNKIQTQLSMQVRQESTLCRPRHRVQVVNYKKSSLRGMKTGSRYHLGNFRLSQTKQFSSNMRKTVLHARQWLIGMQHSLTLSVGKKYIPDGPNNEERGGGERKMSEIKGHVDHLAAGVSHTNENLIKTVMEAKQKLPSLPNLKLPSFPRFVLAQRLITAPKLQEQEENTISEEMEKKQIKKETVAPEVFEREQHNLENAMLHANEELIVFKMESKSQSLQDVHIKVMNFIDKIEELKKKPDTKENNLDVYRMLATFANSLPAINRLIEVDVKKLVKRYRDSSSSSSDVEFPREQHDFESAMSDTYWSTKFSPTDSLNKFETHKPVAKQNARTESVTANGTVRTLLSKAMPISKKEEKKPKVNSKMVISQSSVDYRTKAIVQTIKNAKSKDSRRSRIEELYKHLLKYPDGRHIARKQGVIGPLLGHLHSKDKVLQGEVRKVLALVGYAEPVKGRGIRILTIDGGGTRGIIAVEILRELERQCGKRVHEMFDYVCAVSSGAVLAFLVTIPKVSMDKCEQLFYTLTKDIFKQSALVGTGKLVWNHAFYDTNAWIDILRDHKPSTNLLIETAADPSIPKIAALSTLVNQNTVRPHLFRNYNVPSTVQSHYPGTCQFQLWEALQASTAAPGYFEECKLGGSVHQDGGLMCNNPTAIALHECKQLWPTTPVQCIVSLGTGRYIPEADPGTKNSSSLKTKILQLVMSATDTEVVHSMVSDCTVPGSYFRFNPYLSEDIMLDENRVEKIEVLQRDTRRYLRRNSYKVEETVKTLGLTKNMYHLSKDWVEMKKHIHYG